MLMQRENKVVSYFAAVMLFSIPILAPYGFLGSLSIGLTLLVLLSFLMIVVKQKMFIDRSLFYIAGLHIFLSLVSYFSVSNIPGTEAILWSVIIIGIRVIFISQLLLFYDEEVFLKIAKLFAFIVIGFLIYQIICIGTGKLPPSGQLFSKMVAGIDWVNSAAIFRRPNSFFSEPSYFAIYMLPMTTFFINKGKKNLGLFCLISLFLSTSTLGIAGGIIIIAYFTFVEKNYKVFFLILGIAFIFYNVLYFFHMDWIISLNMNKLTNTQTDSNKLRIFGYLEYFQFLPTINQLIGVGTGQMANVLSQYGIKNYSNAFVIVLMNFGIVGFVGFLFFIKKIWFAVIRKKEKIFVIILLTICAVDAFIYSENFIYVYFFIILFSKNSLYTLYFRKNEYGR